MFKGFNKDMKCRDFQYEEGKSYSEKSADLCNSGFHACEYPLDCFNYYEPNDSVYHEVDLEDVTDQTSNDSKRVGKRITIGARLSLKGIVDASVAFIMEHIDKDKQQTVTNAAATNTGNRSAATNTGAWSAATNTGNWSAATNTGDRSAATNTGDRSAAEVSGKESVAIAIGYQSKARGALGCWIVLAEWRKHEDGTAPYIADVRCAKVNGETIKPDVWYTLVDGKFVEVTEE